MPLLTDKDRYHILKLLEQNPELSQGQIAIEIGLGLEKVNFCLSVLVEKGMIKARYFRESPNKKAYLYILTLKRLEEKS